MSANPSRICQAPRLCALTAAALMTLTAGAGCGDGPICASDISVFITKPDNGQRLIDDSDPFRFGIQSDVVVRTNLRRGERVELEMFDVLGSPIGYYQAIVDIDGTATFPDLTFPEIVDRITARGVTEECGAGSDTIFLDGAAMERCALVVGAQPITTDYYGETDVYNDNADSNQSVAGFQTTVDVLTEPGYEVRLQVDDLYTGTTTDAGTRIADDAAIARYGLTIPDGHQQISAECIGPTGRLSRSEQVEMIVDTEVPACGLVAPLPGTSIGRLIDLDNDASNGIQVEFFGSYDLGEPNNIDDGGLDTSVFLVNYEPFPALPTDTEGVSSFVLTFDQVGVYTVSFLVSDRAGNECIETSDYAYNSDDLVVKSLDRQSAQVSWLVPDDNQPSADGYLVKVAEEPFEPDNFNNTGREVATVFPQNPGLIETVTISDLRPGVEYYVAIISLDIDGQPFRLLEAAGPVTVDFDKLGPIAAPNPDEGDNALGYQTAAGDFNGDGFGDLAVSAPFKLRSVGGGAGEVYVYFGSEDGLSEQPMLTILGSVSGAQLGTGLTAIQWDDDEIDDLAIGAPFGPEGGKVYILSGDSSYGAVSQQFNDTTSEVEISAGDGWFASSALGFALTRARFDGDSREDLIISAPAGGAGDGGVAVVYGGADAIAITLSESDPDAANGAVALVLQDPDSDSIFDSPAGAFFGHYLFNLGATEGALDATDDIGVAYTEKNAAVVFRGRAQPAAPGVTLATFAPALDLELSRSSPDTSSRFGTAMGTIADLDGDGARDIVVGIWREGANLGRVEIVEGDAVGTRDVGAVRITSIVPDTAECAANGCGLGSAVVNNAAGRLEPDIDGDGLEDLIITAGIDAGQVEMLIWYGGQIPTGSVFSTSADHVIPAPDVFEAKARGDSDGTPIAASWVGDVNGDGLEDICWADYSANSLDGAFELLYDDRQ
ncbi:MAG: hypothetical protein Tsb0020_45030 [Haliangiales bacterium]